MTDLRDGRELDGLAADLVMGWTRTEWGLDDCKEYPKFSISSSMGQLLMFREKGSTGVFWHPSEKIQHAWEVHREMCKEKRNYLAQLYLNKLKKVVGERLGLGGRYKMKYRGIVRLMNPLDITRAAVRVMEENDDHN